VSKRRKKGRKKNGPTSANFKEASGGEATQIWGGGKRRGFFIEGFNVDERLI